jgi:hypothetical protein
MTRRLVRWISIAAIIIASSLLAIQRPARADLFGGDVAVLVQILAQAIQQVQQLQQVIGRARETVSILEEMNRGVKEVLRLAETAHIPLPQGVYDQAKQIDQATAEARRLYGIVGDTAPQYTKTQYRSGVESLFLSQDAFEYSRYLDEQGTKIKSSSLVASQATATRLTAQSLGVLRHAISHTNRLEAKQLELSSTQRIEDAAKENAQFSSFVETHDSIEKDMRGHGFSSLNPIGK